MTISEVQIVRKAATYKEVVFAPSGNYPRQVTAIAEDGVTFHLSGGGEVNATACELSDFAILTRLQG